MYQQCTFCNFCNRNEIDSKLLYFISIAREVKFPNEFQLSGDELNTGVKRSNQNTRNAISEDENLTFTYICN